MFRCCYLGIPIILNGENMASLLCPRCKLFFKQFLYFWNEHKPCYKESESQGLYKIYKLLETLLFLKLGHVDFTSLLLLRHINK